MVNDSLAAPAPEHALAGLVVFRTPPGGYPAWREVVRAAQDLLQYEPRS